MEAYTGFAAVYDRFMDNVPYAEWAEYVRELLEGYGIRDGLVLERSEERRVGKECRL